MCTRNIWYRDVLISKERTSSVIKHIVEPCKTYAYRYMYGHPGLLKPTIETTSDKRLASQEFTP